jgi:hypothetical protein
MGVRELVFIILNLVIFQAVSESQSDSRNIPHRGKKKVSLIVI